MIQRARRGKGVNMSSIIQGLINKFQNEDTWLAIGEGFLKIIAILIVAKILIKLGSIANR